MDPSFNHRRSRVRRILLAMALDVILLPLACAVVLFDDLLWQGARKLLRGLENAPSVRVAHAWVAGLPAAAVLPLFLVPEAISHVAGFLSAVLLAKGEVAAAMSLLVVVKGTATLAVVWIYQAASATLLTVRWFASMHATVQFVRDWSLSKVAPLRQALRERLAGSAKIAARTVRRFRALRMYLATLFTKLKLIF